MPRSLRRTFTLLELLVVVFILATVAASAAAVVGQADEQLRHETTRSRLESIRRAVLGRGDLSAPGLSAGFVADMGRVPRDLTELLELGLLPPYAIDADTGVGAGWRGPYLHGLPSLSTGLPSFPDGWGNAPLGTEDPRDFGWVVTVDPPTGDPLDPSNPLTTLSVVSRGADRADGGAELYARDYPAAALVVAADHLVNLRGWQLTCTLHNPSSTAYSETLHLRLTHPRDGLRAQVVGDGQSVSLAPGETQSVTLGFPATADHWVGWGTHALEVVREDLANPGTYLREGGGPAQRVDLLPRSGRPLALPAVWSLP